MPCIRRVFNYGRFYMAPEVKHGRHPLCGQTVETINGDTLHALPFAGFININDITAFDAVVITHVEAFTPGNYIIDKWVELHQYDWLLGHQIENSVYLVIQNDQPIKVGHGKIQISKKHLNNVHSIGF
jgi:hypothetical protein